MELIGSLLLVIAVALVVALFVLRPFLGQASGAPGSSSGEKQLDHQRSSLLAQRDHVLTALQELDFDNALGKIPAEDYLEQRSGLLKTGADALRRLDEMNAGEAEKGSGSVEERIEAAIAARRADSRSGTAGTLTGSDAASVGAASVGAASTGAASAPAAAIAGNGAAKDKLEEMIATRKRQRKESAAGFCPRCGRPVQKSDKFCSRCGADV